MSKARYPWWGYIKQILYRYPECAEFEREAVEKAINRTKETNGGQERLDVISLVFFQKTHKLAGAAMQIPCGYETAKRWQGQFIREVAKNIGLTKE